MDTTAYVEAGQALQAWTSALRLLQDEAERTAYGSADATRNIALLHALEQRAHRAFLAYQEQVLHP